VISLGHFEKEDFATEMVDKRGSLEFCDFSDGEQDSTV
jgi:hypothetical protein